MAGAFLPRLEPEERDALLLAAVPATALTLGAALWAGGRADLAHWTWMAGVLPVLAALLVSIVRSLAKGDFGLDIIAGFAMAGALATGEALAGCVVALMLSGGQALESYAQRRARHEMTALLARVPRSASVYVEGRLETRGVEAIAPGDRLLIRAGEVLPVDGRLASASAALDESALTGESMPVDYSEGAELDSGATNAGEPFDLVALRPAADSTYAGIVRLVESARRSRAPMSRLADRYALGFLALTAALTALAWALTGDPRRALAVLVVATPCPLILAVPVAVVAGMSRCARRGVLVKSAAVLEALPQARFNIDIKAPGGIEPLAATIERHAAHDRVCVGSFHLASITAFRKRTGGRVATSASPLEVGVFGLAPGLRRVWPLQGQAFQMPELEPRTGRRLLTRGMVDAAHRHGAVVHVWTINERPDMERLIDLGVDGIVTDNLATLKAVLVERDLWEGHA